MAIKLYITGCAKSGTTLLCRLMTAYNVKVFVDDERPIDFFYDTQPYQVVKRNCDSILSSEIFTKHALAHDTQVQREWARQIDYLHWRGVQIIHIKRNKSDVLKSEGGYVSESRYNAVLHQENLLKDVISHTVQYEKLIRHPLTVQHEIAVKFGLGIQPGRTWDKYHLWYEPSPNEFIANQYAMRPIGAQYK